MNVVIQLFLFDLSKCQSDYERIRKELRVAEYSAVLVKNLQEESIKQMYILCENENTIDYFSAVVEYNKKANFILIGHQPTYKEILEFVKQTIPPNEIVCIMNGDIFFNSSKDGRLIQKHLQPHHIFALSRHEITNEGHTVHTSETCPFTPGGGSADSFFFYTPLRENLNIERLNFVQNMFGAEAVFLKSWEDAGYEIWNPCQDIITLHLHKDRFHFQQYDYINTPENSTMNATTPLPPIPSHRST